jgi:hypothetical protein
MPSGHTTHLYTNDVINEICVKISNTLLYVPLNHEVDRMSVKHDSLIGSYYCNVYDTLHLLITFSTPQQSVIIYTNGYDLLTLHKQDDLTLHKPDDDLTLHKPDDDFILHKQDDFILHNQDDFILHNQDDLKYTLKLNGPNSEYGEYSKYLEKYLENNKIIE